MRAEFSVKGAEEISRKLRALSYTRWYKVMEFNMKQIYDRGKGGGTPVRTGQLRNSIGQSGLIVGYTAHYAPHVEFGHRTRGGGGYVQGRYFLKKNVDAQWPILYRTLLAELERA